MNYDPALQAQVQAVADKCKFEHSGTTGVGENIYWNSAKQPQVDAALSACEMWWAELAQAGINPDLVLRAEGFGAIGHMTQMAWAGSYSFACAIGTSCTDTLFFCQYSPQGNIIGEKMYEAGAQCHAASDCTTHSGSTCDTGSGLCQKPR